jgi:hypothetical protein
MKRIHLVEPAESDSKITELKRRSCPLRDRLAADVDEVLQQIVNITSNLRTAFQNRDRSLFEHLDQQLELAIGQKERSIGALREHKKEHGCG